MFIEFDAKELREWNNISETQKKQLIENKEVQIAVDIEIKIETNQEVSEIHKFYRIATFGNSKLLDNINLFKITEQDTFFYINFNNSNEPELVSIKNGEEKSFEIRDYCNKATYKIKVSNVKYGQIVEL